VFEVQSAAGVPDVVATVFDQDVLDERAGSGFVTDASGVSALLALSDAREAWQSLDAREVAAATGLTPSYIRARVLPGLAARGLALMTAPGRWTAANQYRSPARRLVTVEAKLSDWRRGLGQAARHAAGADEAWLVLDAVRTRPAVTKADWFRAAGVGLAGLGRDGTLETLLEPDGAAILHLRARRELLAERLAELHCSGAASGPVGCRTTLAGSGTARPWRVRVRLTVAAGTFTRWWCCRCQAMVCEPASRPCPARSLRSRVISSTVPGPMAFGEVLGRWDRGSNADSPSAR
jgi:hypothetical protein